MYINHFSTRHPLTSTPTCSLCPTCSSCMAGRGMADPKQSYGVENFLVPTAARVWGRELLWYVTVVSWGQGSRVCSVSFPGKNRGHDCHGVTWNCCLLFSPAQIECKWLAVTDNFIPLMTSGSSGVIDPFLKSEYLLLVLMAFLGSGFWCPKKLWVSVNMSPRWGRVKKKLRISLAFCFKICLQEFEFPLTLRQVLVGQQSGLVFRLETDLALQCCVMLSYTLWFVEWSNWKIPRLDPLTASKWIALNIKKKKITSLNNCFSLWPSQYVLQYCSLSSLAPSVSLKPFPSESWFIQLLVFFLCLGEDT